MANDAKKDNTDKNEQKAIAIADLKQQKITALTTKFNVPMMRERLVNLAKGDENLVVANLNSFLTILANDEGTGKWDNKKYLVHATTSSLALCFMESMQIGIPIDRRGLVHIVVYNTQAELEIDYKGFIYYLSKHYTDADFDIKLVFEGDTFNHWSDSGDDKYEYKKDPARTVNDYRRVTWAFMFMTYVKNGRERSKIEVMDKRELDLVKSKAKTQAVWEEWLGEMYKKAVCRRACKLPLASVDENAIEAIDNRNFELEKPAVLNRLENLMQNQEDMLNADKKPEDKKDEEKKPEGTPATDPASPDKGKVAGDANDEKPPASAGNEASGDQGSAAPEAGAGLRENAAGDDVRQMDDADPADQGTTIEGTATQVTAEAEAWDGKTIYISGKAQNKNFETTGQALNYLRSVISKRNSKQSRKDIIAENPKLMGALIREGKGSAIADLHKLADLGN